MRVHLNALSRKCRGGYTVSKRLPKQLNQTPRLLKWHLPNLSILNGPTYSGWPWTAGILLHHCAILSTRKFGLDTIFGGSISEQEKTLFSLPTCKGELWVCDPVESAQHFHCASVEGTVKTVSSIKSEEEFSVLEHTAMAVKAQAKLRKHRVEQNQRKRQLWSRWTPGADV